MDGGIDTSIDTLGWMPTAEHMKDLRGYNSLIITKTRALNNNASSQLPEVKMTDVPKCCPVNNANPTALKHFAEAGFGE